MIFVDLNDLVQTASFKGQGLGKHLIDGGAANNRKMSEIVVIRLKQQRFLLNLIGELDESQEMMLCKLAPAAVVDVDASNAVTVEGGSAILALKSTRGGCFNFRGGVLFREGEQVAMSEGQGVQGSEGRCFEEGCCDVPEVECSFDHDITM